MRIKPWILPCLMLSGGATWNIWPAGAAVLSLLLPAGVIQADKHSTRWWLAFIWFFAGSISIVPSAAGFFGTQYLALGIAAWIASSALLALPWIIASTPIGAVMAALLDAIPPIGLIGWLSPLTAAGWLFPRQGLAGVAGCLTVMAWIAATAKRNNCHGCKVSARTGVMGDRYSGILKLMAGILAMWIIIANLRYVPPATPVGWVGIQTSIQPSNGDVFQAITNNRALIAAAQSQGSHAKYLVFPEAVLDDWWPGTRSQVAAAVPQGQTWIIGAETLAPGARYDALVIAQQHRAQRDPVFRAALPMPVSMWRPGFTRSFQGVWHEPVQIIDGHRVWANICFDQVLPLVWIDGMLQSPDLILLPSNSWWAQPWNPAPEIQKTQAQAWVRAMRVATVWANNRQLSKSVESIYQLDD